MVVYFSGTGNSRYCAEFLARHLEDECIDAFHFIRDGIAAELINWLPVLVKAALIVLAAFVGANLVEGALTKCCAKAAKAAKVAVFTVAGFMLLSQLGIASAIVEKVFVLMVAALAVAFAIAFGLGGKEFAFKTLKKLEEKNKE